MWLLDLSAAFDCVHHDILMSRLEQNFDVNGLTLEWIRSYLMNQTPEVVSQVQLSGILRFVFGVPQGSLSVTLLFMFQTAELLDIIKECMQAYSHNPKTHRPMTALKLQMRRRLSNDLPDAWMRILGMFIHPDVVSNYSRRHLYAYRLAAYFALLHRFLSIRFFSHISGADCIQCVRKIFIPGVICETPSLQTSETHWCTRM